MPDEENKTVDIDTSGPDVQIELPEEKQEQDESDEKVEKNGVC